MDFPQGKNIEIYLPTGDPQDLRIAQVTSRTIQALYINRDYLTEACKREEAQQVSVYFLFGKNNSGRMAAYIGETGNFATRIVRQKKDKDFWREAVVISSKTRLFTKAHVLYLEWYCLKQAKKSGRYLLTANTNSPTKPHLSEATEADLLDSIATIQLLTRTLGFPILDVKVDTKTAQQYQCKGKKAYAFGCYEKQCFIVSKGSLANLEETSTLPDGYKQLRRQLIEQGILIVEGESLRFAEDYSFSSASAASSVVLGRSSNGWNEWKRGDGLTLDNIERKGLKKISHQQSVN